MKPDRLNAFTDGVIAIIITIIVLELRIPEEASLQGLMPVLPVFAAYVLSFINIGIFWNNHHHMMQAARAVDGRVLWANLALLFWLSLTPFVIRWIDDVGVSPLPIAAYGVVMGMAAISYQFIEWTLRWAEGPGSRVSEAIGAGAKEWSSLALYASGAALAFVSPFVSVGLYILVSAMWLVPDRRFEKQR